MNSLAIDIMAVLLRYHGRLPTGEIDTESLRLVLGPSLYDTDNAERVLQFPYGRA